jgi:hypothetical protein
MPLVVETGSGSATANSYASVAQANDYVSLRKLGDWSALAPLAREAALVAATDYLEEVYASLWLGQRLTQAQALSWPRQNVIVEGFTLPATVVPNEVSKACILLAIKVGAGETLLEDQGQRVIKEKIDVIETEYAEFSDPRTRYLQVDQTLAKYLAFAVAPGSFSQARLNRV